jgi:hypothetical protein
MRKAFESISKDNEYAFKVILVHGTASGADLMGEHIAKELGWSIERHPAKWHTHDDNCPGWHEGEPVCKRAGFRRNEEMVKLGADICLAFIKQNSVGATGCANSAEKKGIPTERFRE